MPKIIHELNQQNLALINKFITQGEIISFPTETVFALAADATNSFAVDRIYEAKKRSADKALPVLVKDLETAMSLVEFNKKAIKLAEKFFPGPLTLVLKTKINQSIAKNMHREKTTIAVRIPNSDAALKILEAVKVPLIGTSANLSNEPSAISAKEVEDYFQSKVSCIVEKSGPLLTIPSTIVDLSEDLPILVRSGAITKELIEEVLGEKLQYV